MSVLKPMPSSVSATVSLRIVPKEFDPKTASTLRDEVPAKPTFERIKQLVNAQFGTVDRFLGGWNNLEATPRNLGIKEDLSKLHDKSFLVLGCGSEHSKEDIPWMPRILAKVSKLVVGIDLAPQGDKEEFTGFEMNLLQPGALNILKDSSFDYVICTMLIGFVRSEDENISPVLEDSSSPYTREIMRNELIRQTNRLLVEGGLVVNDYTTYRKRGKELVRLSIDEIEAIT